MNYITLTAHFSAQLRGKSNFKNRILRKHNLLYRHIAISIRSELQQTFQTTAQRTCLVLTIKQLFRGFNTVFGSTAGHTFVHFPFYNIQLSSKGSFTVIRSTLQIIIHIINAVDNSIAGNSSVNIIFQTIHTLQQGTALLRAIEHFFHSADFICHRDSRISSKTWNYCSKAKDKGQQ